MAEKYYENLVEALTNNDINTGPASSNLTLSLPQSLSPTFPTLSDQNDTYRIEEPETFHNSEGDIAEWFMRAGVSSAISVVQYLIVVLN